MQILEPADFFARFGTPDTWTPLEDDMATKIPGIKATHAIITPNCRTVPRPQHDPDPVAAAFDEAVARLRKEYLGVCRMRGDGFNAHVVLTIEPPSTGEE